MVTKADFIGFEFAGQHSSELGIIRTSDGDRFDEELTPEIKDVTVEVPGMHGEYFFGSTYGTRTFNISFAFDHLTEEQFRKLRRVYGRKQIGELIFDERPYKKYMAKIESPIELSYVCFDEPKRVVVGTSVGDERYGVRVVNRTTTSNTEEVENEETGEVTEVTTYTTTIERERIYPYEIQEGTERVYKGDGTITFVCYFPFAKSVYKQLPFIYQKTNDEVIVEGKKYFTYNSSTLLYTLVSEPLAANLNDYYERVSKPEVNDWAISSGLLSVNEYENIDKYNDGIINVYNAGDVATGFRLYVPFVSAAAESEEEEEENESNNEEESVVLSTINPLTLTYKQNINAQTVAILNIDEITQQGDDVGVIIDTNNNLIVGVSTFGYDQNSNVQYTTSGNLYNEYVDSGYFFKLEPNIKSDGATIEIEGGIEGIEIFYDYLYF